jgi:hypothetical protein
MHCDTAQPLRSAVTVAPTAQACRGQAALPTAGQETWKRESLTAPPTCRTARASLLESQVCRISPMRHARERSMNPARERHLLLLLRKACEDGPARELQTQEKGPAP